MLPLFLSLSRFVARPSRIASLSLLLAAPLAIRAQVVGGSISGTVSDSSGGRISGASVRVVNSETGTERKLVTDHDGRYSAPSISVGTYKVVASGAGFGTQERKGISITVGQSTQVDVVLSLGEVAQEVQVQASGATVDVSTQQTSGLVNERQVKELPLNGRSYDQLITLNPATVNYTGQRSGGIGTSNSSVGNMFSISGRRPQDNLFLLNGIEYTGASLINVTPGGTSGQLLGVDAVREFNVVSDSYSASFGKRQGSQISIVTAGGTNNLHGSAYEFIRNSALDARNYFDQAQTNGRRLPEFQRNNFGGSLGGPIRSNKLFLFGNYEGYRQNLGLSDVTFVPDAQVRQGFFPDANGVYKPTTLGAGVAPLFNLWPTQNGPELLDSNGHPTGIALAFSSPKQKIREDFGTTRFDANLSGNDLLFAVYTIDDSTANTPTQNPLAQIDESLREQVLSVQEQHVFSPRLLNTARIGFSRASFYFMGTSTPLGGANVPGWVQGKPIGAIVIAGSTASNGSSQITGAGANVGANNATARNLFTFDDHIFYTRGKHQIEAGGWLQRLQSNDNLAQNQFGQASFTTLQTFLAGTVATFSEVPAPTGLGWRSWMGAGYLEDTVKLTPRLEVRAGIRFESTNGFNEVQGRASRYGFTNGVIDTNPTVGSSGLTTNKAKFLPEPRAGIAWDVFGNGKTAIRGSVGLHHSLLDNLDYRFDQSAPFNTTLSLKNVAVSSLNITPSTTAGAGALVSPSNVQPDLATPAVVSWTFKVEQQVAPNTSLTVAYIGSHGYNQILSGDQNEPATVTCPNPACPASLSVGTVFYPNTTKANPLVANTTSWFSAGISNYNALEVDLRRNFAHGLQFRGNYTFAKNLDNGSAWNTSVSANTPAFVSVPTMPGLDYGRAATDLRHIGAVNGTYELPFGRNKMWGSNLRPLAERAVGGWSLSAIGNFQSGFPFSPQLGYNPTGSGDTRNPVRPNVNPNFHGNLYPHTVTKWFDPAAFSAPLSTTNSSGTITGGAVGNLGRDTLVGPGLTELDMSLLKNTRFRERINTQFRAEFFNVLNHSNFTTPNPIVFSALNTTASSTAGVITATATSSRQIQFGLKVSF
ncbi:TonB-dependent receptor [Granulicella sp. dw_53]|uniref:TonB-dependent receptor n=1 Tax=Granulicella sp. dw_53 TaxID=2719792 RepID=UPI0021079F59|nr:TonB-dependent receptor [Granulicella sp. dw_53]